MWNNSKSMHSCKTTNSGWDDRYDGTAHMTEVMRWMLYRSTKKTDREGDRGLILHKGTV